MPIYGNPNSKNLFSFLKGYAYRVGTRAGATRTNLDLLCRAVRFAVVINAILHVTADSLNVILGNGATFLIGTTIHLTFLLSRNTIIILKNIAFIPILYERRQEHLWQFL